MPFFIPVFRDVSGGGCQNPYLFGKNFNLLGFFEKKIPNPPTPQNFSFIQENLNPLLKKISGYAPACFIIDRTRKR